MLSVPCFIKVLCLTWVRAFESYALKKLLGFTVYLEFKKKKIPCGLTS